MEPRRCQVHGLVLPPEGKCLICARGREQKGSRGSRTSSGTYLGLIAGLLVVSALAFGGLRYFTKDTTSATSIDEMVPTNAGKEAPAEDDFVEPPPPPPRRASRNSFSKEAGQRRPGGPPGGGDELSAAMHGVKITMYSAPWCDVCKAARRWLSAEGYKFTDLDVEASKTDSIVHRSLNPRGSVPTFDVEGTVLVGFDERRMLQAIKSKAESKGR